MFKIDSSYIFKDSKCMTKYATGYAYEMNYMNHTDVLLGLPCTGGQSSFDLMLSFVLLSLILLLSKSSVTAILSFHIMCTVFMQY